MKTLKSIIFQKFELLFLLSIACMVPILVLMLRLKLSHSFFYLFLVWNLFLAAIPYFISFYLSHKRNLGNTKLIFFGIVWLLFLPNAPYIITDLMHLRLSKGLFIGIDLILVISFSVAGMLFYWLSVNDMLRLIKINFSEKVMKIVGVIIPFLCGFGIYLGRFLRFNSWDLVNNPIQLAYDVLQIIFFPNHNITAWLITLVFGIFLYLSKRFITPRLQLFIKDHRR